MRYNTGVVYVIDTVLLPNDKNFLDKYGLKLTYTRITQLRLWELTSAPIIGALFYIFR